MDHYHFASLQRPLDQHFGGSVAQSLLESVYGCLDRFYLDLWDQCRALAVRWVREYLSSLGDTSPLTGVVVGNLVDAIVGPAPTRRFGPVRVFPVDRGTNDQRRNPWDRTAYEVDVSIGVKIEVALLERSPGSCTAADIEFEYVRSRDRDIRRLFLTVFAEHVAAFVPLGT